MDSSSLIEWVKALGSLGTFAAAFAVWFGLRYTRQSVENQTVQLKADSRSRIDELFYKASEQISGDNGGRKIAGLYTLERIANDEAIDMYHQCIETICAFMRSESETLTMPEPLDKEARVPEYLSVGWQILGRRRNVFGDGESEPLDLSGVKAVGVTIERGDFCGANLTQVDFRNARLDSSRFASARFDGSQFDRCTWKDSDFSGCIFFKPPAGASPIYFPDPPNFRWPPLITHVSGAGPATLVLYSREYVDEGEYDPLDNFGGTIGIDDEFLSKVEDFPGWIEDVLNSDEVQF